MGFGMGIAGRSLGLLGQAMSYLDFHEESWKVYNEIKYASRKGQGSATIMRTNGTNLIKTHFE